MEKLSIYPTKKSIDWLNWNFLVNCDCGNLHENDVNFLQNLSNILTTIVQTLKHCGKFCSILNLKRPEADIKQLHDYEVQLLGEKFFTW